MLKIILALSVIFFLPSAFCKKKAIKSPQAQTKRAKKIPSKKSRKISSQKEITNQEEEEDIEEGGFQPSLMESLNNSNQLKSDIKREIALKVPKKSYREPAKKSKKTIQFGVMNLKISDRKEEEILKKKK